MSVQTEKNDNLTVESVTYNEQILRLSDIIIIKEEGKKFKEQKEKEKNRCCNNQDDTVCFSFSFWCCFLDECTCDCNC